MYAEQSGGESGIALRLFKSGRDQIKLEAANLFAKIQETAGIQAPSLLDVIDFGQECVNQGLQAVDLYR